MPAWPVTTPLHVRVIEARIFSSFLALIQSSARRTLMTVPQISAKDSRTPMPLPQARRSLFALNITSPVRKTPLAGCLDLLRQPTRREISFLDDGAVPPLA